MARIPAIIIGATGYVGAELMRLIGAHPHLTLVAAVSRAQAGERIAQVFPHLAPLYPDATFATPDSALEQLTDHDRVALFSAAPHAQSAGWVARFLSAAPANCELHCVDASADFRFSDASAFEKTYGEAHPHPELLGSFCTGLPEHWMGASRPHAGNPGCFATAMLLACKPLLDSELTKGDLFAAGITGSTGSGKSATATTHHPERHANLYSYNPLGHRHVPEVRHLLDNGKAPTPALNFVPHSGPFARGIHMTVQASLRAPVSDTTVLEHLSRCYENAPFIRVSEDLPKLKQVTGSNYARVSARTNEGSVAVSVVIDNLVKGAAGGAVQWMNRLHRLDETDGLTAPAVGFS